MKREGIIISLGFTANINVELALATLQETVTVTGESPVIDTSATRVVQNFKLEELQSIPNGRDFWSLLAISPGVRWAASTSAATARARRRRTPRTASLVRFAC